MHFKNKCGLIMRSWNSLIAYLLKASMNLFQCYLEISLLGVEVISFRLFWWAQLIKWFKRRKIILLWWLTDFIERLFAFIDSSGMNIAAWLFLPTFNIWDKKNAVNFISNRKIKYRILQFMLIFLKKTSNA